MALAMQILARLDGQMDRSTTLSVAKGGTPHVPHHVSSAVVGTMVVVIRVSETIHGFP